MVELRDKFVTTKAAINFGPVRFTEPADSAFLEDLFADGWNPDPVAAAAPYEPSGLDEDPRRDRVYREIATRRGQPAFRQRLLEAYGYRCAITGSNAHETLEAAHITAYGEAGSNHPSNGLLPRADLR